MKNYIKKIEQIIQIRSNNKELPKSFIHKSYTKNENNEKLEF